MDPLKVMCPEGVLRELQEKALPWLGCVVSASFQAALEEGDVFRPAMTTPQKPSAAEPASDDTGDKPSRRQSQRTAVLAQKRALKEEHERQAKLAADIEKEQKLLLRMKAETDKNDGASKTSKKQTKRKQSQKKSSKKKKKKTTPTKDAAGEGDEDGSAGHAEDDSAGHAEV